MKHGHGGGLVASHDLKFMENVDLIGTIPQCDRANVDPLEGQISSHSVSKLVAAKSMKHSLE